MYHRHSLGVMLIAGVILLLTLMPPRSVAAQEQIPATVISIVDGDTIKVQAEAGPIITVRLIGIDTPETKHPSKPVQCFGPEASARAAELLPSGSTGALERDVQEQDRYGRTLAYVWSADGTTMVNEQLAAEGYAVLLTIPPDVRYVERFRVAQQSAREQGAGLWSGCNGNALEASDDAPVTDDQAAAGPTAAPQQPAPATPASSACDPSYPDFCIAPAPPDLNCTSAVIAGHKNFRVLQPDPHHFDSDKDGVGCESRR